VGEDVGDNYLSIAMGKVALVEDWCKAVRAETERRLLAGEQVTGYKLVEGRKGARKWASEKEAERILKSFRLKQEQIYEHKLITPAKAEKLLKENPKRWAKLSDLIAQSMGKPSVAHAADKRSEMTTTTVAEDFDGLFETANVRN
jgi:sugar phosphate isomerase/epimerase